MQERDYVKIFNIAANPTFHSQYFSHTTGQLFWKRGQVTIQLFMEKLACKDLAQPVQRLLEEVLEQIGVTPVARKGAGR